MCSAPTFHFDQDSCKSSINLIRCAIGASQRFPTVSIQVIQLGSSIPDSPRPLLLLNSYPLLRRLAAPYNAAYGPFDYFEIRANLNDQTDHILCCTILDQHSASTRLVLYYYYLVWYEPNEYSGRLTLWAPAAVAPWEWHWTIKKVIVPWFSRRDNESHQYKVLIYLSVSDFVNKARI
jgi:hypothetical protein